jgi:Flp pilus assembly protein TadD
VLTLSRAAAVALFALTLGACQTVGNETAGPATGGTIEDRFASAKDPGVVAREHFARQDYGLAEQWFREAVERSPGDADLWIGLAASYDQLGRFELADRAYASAAKLKGDDFRLLNNRGYSYLLRGDAKRAAGMFERALALDPTNEVVANNLALVGAETGRAKAAGL